MRVITGRARGMNLRTLPGSDVRPTTEKVKEAVFSMLQFELLHATVLDLFAGSGQLGIEALSRGADTAVFVDSGRHQIDIIKQNLEKTKLIDDADIRNEDAFSYLAKTSLTFHIAFLDPPYKKELCERALPLVEEHMARGGVIVCETSDEETLPQNVGRFSKYKECEYGMTKITVYRMAEEND